VRKQWGNSCWIFCWTPYCRLRSHVTVLSHLYHPRHMWSLVLRSKVETPLANWSWSVLTHPLWASGSQGFLQTRLFWLNTGLQRAVRTCFWGGLFQSNMEIKIPSGKLMRQTRMVSLLRSVTILQKVLKDCKMSWSAARRTLCAQDAGPKKWRAPVLPGQHFPLIQTP
jgi:hypothetical protein